MQLSDSAHWTLVLHENQSYLGRVCLVAKRPDAVDFFDMLPAEQSDLFAFGHRVKRALTTLFAPDLFNYASLGNTYRHLHIHLIPRYASPRTFAGLPFRDARWGQNYEPYDRGHHTAPPILQQIADAIVRHLEPPP